MVHLFILLILFITACSAPAKKYVRDDLNHTSDSGKILIVYLSRTNNTKLIAEIIQRNTGGTMVAIELEKPYPAN